MQFLSNLGIDINLLIAQIINFGLLLWLLTKFLYKPIVNRIEKDETELRQALIQKKELELDKHSFIEERKKSKDEIQKQAQEIIKEAKEISLEIEKKVRKKTNNEVASLIEQTKNNLDSIHFDIEKKVFKKIQNEIGNSFNKSFTKVLSPYLQKEFQNIFWVNFIEQVKALEIPELKEPTLVEITNKLKNKKGTSGYVLEKELNEIFSRKIGAIILESAYPLTTEQEEELEKIISEKAVVKLNIIKKQNKNLINGFRFEIAGMIIESNLLNIINDASSFKK